MRTIFLLQIRSAPGKVRLRSTQLPWPLESQTWLQPAPLPPTMTPLIRGSNSALLQLSTAPARQHLPREVVAGVVVVVAEAQVPQPAGQVRPTPQDLQQQRPLQPLPAPLWLRQARSLRVHTRLGLLQPRPLPDLWFQPPHQPPPHRA